MNSVRAIRTTLLDRRTNLAALVLAVATSFVVAIDAIRGIRLGVLLDAEPSWSWIRLLLGLVVPCLAVAAGAAVAAVFLAWARLPAAAAPLAPIPFRATTLAAVTAAAIVAGVALRFHDLSRSPSALWVDDLSLIPAALELKGSPSDFADSIRATPHGVPKPYGSVGVLYLEGYRAALRAAGTTVFGVRLPSALAGAVSLVTAALLGRALLPAGGGMWTALILAGLRWHLILSRWAWNMIVLAPIVDLATLALLVARRRRNAAPALGAGLLAGVGAHVYLSAWPAGAALGLFALWPAAKREEWRPRIGRCAAYALGFAVAAAPLFALREGRAFPYFARTADHNVWLETHRTRSWMPPLAAAADAAASPWFIADPTPRHDLPGRSRLGWLLGVPVAIVLFRAVLQPRDELAGLVLSHGAAFVASCAASGMADNPNGSRFGYLTSLAAVAAAAGAMWLLGLVRDSRRHLAAVGATGALAVAGAFSARDAVVVWPSHRATFLSFDGQDTLIGRAAARWETLGPVEIPSGLGHSPLAIEAVRRYHLDPDRPAGLRSAAPARLRARIVEPGTSPRPGERVVERIDDGWGRRWAVVLARRAGDS